MFFIAKNAHYSGSLQALQDIFFVEKNARGVRVGLSLIKFHDQELKKEGVQLVYQHVKIDHPALGRLLDHENYNAVEIMYSKRLD